MKAAIYCRVSTEDQEKEGTSLHTQLENCLKYCQSKGYDVAYRYSEAYSGLTLDRPKLNELRELVRNEAIDVVVVYCLDRLSRNATHGVIVRDELDKHHVAIESVTEDIDKTPLGEAITYLRGTFAQIEAEKIKERTLRGKRARAREGRISNGGFHKLYGYDYIPVREKDGGRRVVNENEAKYVRLMFDWLVKEGMTTNAIAARLNSEGVLPKYINRWSRTVVWGILSNPAYTGKTVYHSGESIEIPDVTPPVIDKALFKAAQKQLIINAQKARRNMKRDYLLHGHLYCSQCGRPYWSHICVQKGADNTRYEYRRYVCSGNMTWNKAERCHNKGWQAERLEAMVWAKLEAYFSNRDLIDDQLNKQRQDADHLSAFYAELERVEHQLKAAEREQHQLLQWALKGFPEEQVEAENRRLNKAKETLTAQKSELGAQIKASQEAAINVPKLESFIKNVQGRIQGLDFEGKRLVLSSLGIKVWLDPDNVDITGVLNPENYVIAPVSSGVDLHNNIVPFSLKICNMV